MTTIKRFTPDYKMHAVRFEAFAREAEHGEYVQFDAHQQEVCALEAERDALAVENQALKDVFGPGEAVVNFLSIALRRTNYDYINLPDVALAFKMSLPETPATDAALAEIKAQGVEKFAAWASEQESLASDSGDKKEARIYCQVAARANHFAGNLREAK
ncbi:hypothetical protein FOT43_14570 [Serratia marcescens]|uniref:hypothetical protein n=1 Tax=Serratia marcescens TaxID=615 RepID=UPI00118156D3|nr:hypothetical protein [Serratia marcescens]TSB27327.1 hypothetical protein FOT43_14570 [Serratia marcescens]TXE39746.1 hypothetical protein FOT60_19580 [Serratia marcescens]